MKRFKLAFDRCQSDVVEYYQVYRRGEDEEAQHIMNINQVKTTNPVTVVDQVLTLMNGVWHTAHAQILLSYPVVIKVNGVELMPTDFETGEGNGTGNGTFFIATSIPEDALVTADYTFDGIAALDDDHLQDGVEYIGPPVTAWEKLKPPVNPVLLYDNANNSLVLSWKLPENIIFPWWYHVVACDNNGNRSWPSNEVNVVLSIAQEIAFYIIQKKMVDGTWVQVATSETLQFIENVLDDLPIPNPTDLTTTIELLHSTGTGNVMLNWVPARDSEDCLSEIYRVIASDGSGHESDPSPEVGPIAYQHLMTSQVIRRKVADGLPPSFDGEDAVTVAILNSLEDTFIDEAVTDETTYTYAVYSVKNKDHGAFPAIAQAAIGDATPPSAPQSLSVHDEVL